MSIKIMIEQKKNKQGLHKANVDRVISQRATKSTFKIINSLLLLTAFFVRICRIENVCLVFGDGCKIYFIMVCNINLCIGGNAVILKVGERISLPRLMSPREKRRIGDILHILLNRRSLVLKQITRVQYFSKRYDQIYEFETGEKCGERYYKRYTLISTYENK